MIVLQVQEFIHRLEEGVGTRYVKLAFVSFAFAVMALLYDSLCFKNLASSEGMDNAQLAANIADGKGYTTLFVRPISMALLREHDPNRSVMIKGDHPDLANAPAYPTLLAAVLKFVPEPHELLRVKQFTKYSRDVAIAVMNQVLLFIGCVLVFRLARMWFDNLVAWVAAVLFAATELYWRFSISGLSTILLMDILLGIALTLTALELRVYEEGSSEQLGPRNPLPLALLAGVLVGLGALTRYSFAWLILPVCVFIGVFLGPQRGKLCTVTLLSFLVVFGPWVARNFMVSGMPFGTATFAAIEQTPLFPSDTLERSLSCDFSSVYPSDYMRKVLVNTRDMLQNELPRMGGNWLWAFFFVGLLVRFQNPTLSRLRWFVIMALVVFIPVQALGRTRLSIETPELNSENLLVLLSPLTLVLGVGLFFVLLDSIELPGPLWRLGAITTFIMVISSPLILAFLPPRPNPIVYPPYYPPRLQQMGTWLEKHELMMSDIPWAIAWYGRRQCVSLTLNPKKDFSAISDYEKSINALYLTTRTTDAKFLSYWMRTDTEAWGSFLLEALVRRQVPSSFPLRSAQVGELGLFVDGQIFLTDYERWHGKRNNP